MLSIWVDLKSKRGMFLPGYFVMIEKTAPIDHGKAGPPKATTKQAAELRPCPPPPLTGSSHHQGRPAGARAETRLGQEQKLISTFASTTQIYIMVLMRVSFFFHFFSKREKYPSVTCPLVSRGSVPQVTR